MADTVNLGVIGAGNFCGQYHAPALSALKTEFPRLRLRAICDLNLKRAELLADRFGFEQAFEDHHRMLDADIFHALYVTVPPSCLKALVLDIAPRNLPVFMEKPPGLSSADTLAMAAALKQPHMVGFNRRFMPLSLKFKERLPQFGPAPFFEARMLRYRRAEPDFIFGTGIHAIDLMVFLGGPVKSVDTVLQETPGGPAKACHLVFHFASGACGSLFINPDTGVRIEHYAVHGPGRCLLLRAPYHFAADFPGGLDYSEGPEKTETFRMPAGLPDWETIGVGNEARAFLRHLTTGGPAGPTLTDCVQSMRIAEKACRGESITLMT
jgi:predicted dehydrogenase